MKNLEIKAVFVLASNHFRKSFSINAGVLLRMENGFSGKEFPGKEFQLTVKLRPLTWKIFSAKILPSNHFLRRAKRERERERTHTRKQRERERSRTQKSGDRRTTGEIVNPRLSNPRTASCTNPRTTNGEPTNPQTANPRTANPWTHDRIANSRTTSHTAPITPASRTVTYLALVLVTSELHRYRSCSCDFDFLLSLFDLWFFCCCCGGMGGGVLVVFLLCGGGFCVGGGGK